MQARAITPNKRTPSPSRASLAPLVRCSSAHLRQVEGAAAHAQVCDLIGSSECHGAMPKGIIALGTYARAYAGDSPEIRQTSGKALVRPSGVSPWRLTP